MFKRLTILSFITFNLFCSEKGVIEKYRDVNGYYYTYTHKIGDKTKSCASVEECINLNKNEHFWIYKSSTNGKNFKGKEAQKEFKRLENEYLSLPFGSIFNFSDRSYIETRDCK